MDELTKRKEELLSREEVAVAIDASISTVERLLRNGILSAIKVGSRTYIKKAEVAALLEGGAR